MLFAQELVHSTYNISTVVGWIPRGISHLHLHWHFSYSVAILLYGYFPILCLLQLFMFIEFPSFISHVFMELISSYIPTFGGYILIPAGYQAISIFINWIIWFLIVISSYIHKCIKYPSKENLYIYHISHIYRASWCPSTRPCGWKMWWMRRAKEASFGQIWMSRGVNLSKNWSCWKMFGREVSCKKGWMCRCCITEPLYCSRHLLSVSGCPTVCADIMWCFLQGFDWSEPHQVNETRYIDSFLGMVPSWCWCSGRLLRVARSRGLRKQLEMGVTGLMRSEHGAIGNPESLLHQQKWRFLQHRWGFNSQQEMGLYNFTKICVQNHGSNSKVIGGPDSRPAGHSLRVRHQLTMVIWEVDQSWCG